MKGRVRYVCKGEGGEREGKGGVGRGGWEVEEEGVGRREAKKE